MKFSTPCNGELLVADYNGGKPTYSARMFRVVMKHNVPTVEILPNQDCPGACPFPSSAMVLGVDTEAKPLAQSPTFWAAHSRASGIEELIQTEARAHPDEVGGSVSILALDKNGPHWVPGY